MLKNNWIALFFVIVCLVLSPPALHAKTLSYKKNADGVTFKLETGAMKIRVCKDDIIEVKYTILNSFPQKQSLVVNNKWLAKTQFTVNSIGNVVYILTKKLKITVDKTTNTITYSDLNNHVICAEYKGGNKTMQPATIAGIQTYNCETQFNSPANEGLFGLGCHPVDSLSINYSFNYLVQLLGG